jgi:hypothetical protein
VSARRLLVSVVALAGLALPAPASAVTIGKADPFDINSGAGRCDYVGVFYIGVPVPPGGGTITSWTTSNNPTGTRFALLDVRQGEDGTTVVAHTDLKTITRAYKKNTFATHLAVQGGDFLALRVPAHENFPVDCFYSSDGKPGLNGDMYANEGALVFDDDDGYGHGVPDGGRADPHGSYPGGRVNLQATLKPPHACIVPNVLAKHLARARRMLHRGHCRVGRVHGRHRHGVVMRQSRNGGAVLQWNAPIALWLDKR